MISNKISSIATKIQYVYHIDIYIAYNNDSYNITTSKLSCYDKNDISTYSLYDMCLPKNYTMSSKTKTLRYLKEQIYSELYHYIIKVNDKSNDFEMDINFVVDTTNIPNIDKDDKLCINKYKYEYSEDNISWTNYFKSMMYGKINTEKCSNYKPFYLKFYYESDGIEDKLDLFYTKVMSFNNRNILPYTNYKSQHKQNKWINIKNVNIDYIDGINIYYNEYDINNDYTFEIIVLIFDNYINKRYGEYRKTWIVNKMKWYCDDIAYMVFGNYECMCIN